MCQTASMGFYDDLIRGLNSSFGDGTPYPNYTALARHCNVYPAQLQRYKDGNSSASLQVIGRILDGIGAKLVFPGESLDGTPINENQMIAEILSLKKQLAEREREMLLAEGRIAELREMVERHSGQK